MPQTSLDGTQCAGTYRGVFALLVLVIADIRAEERHMSLTSGPRTRARWLARRLTGASARWPSRTRHCPYQDGRR